MSGKTMARGRRAGKGSFKDTREDSLLYLGMTDYLEYLASPLWKSIRTKVLDRENRICRLCADTATQVHHRQYNRATMLGDDISHLVALCENCHQLIEFDRGRKCPADEAERRYSHFEGKEGRLILHRRVKELSSEVDALKRRLSESVGQTISTDDLRRAQEFHRLRVGEIKTAGGPQ